jgi:hypothetical protein
MDKEQSVAAVLAAADAAEPTITEPADKVEVPPGFGGGLRSIEAWRYRGQFEPDVSKPALDRIAAAFESIAVSLQDLSYAQNILAADTVYKTERQF